METKLYVGNLSFNTTEEDLRTLFSQAGSVTSVELIKDRDTGSSKGFAFITMGSQAEMEKAITTFNELMVDNRVLKVNIARPREERPRSGYTSNNYSNYRSGGRGSDNRKSRTGGGNRRY
jgi:RNA recognition motif-containing protein